MRIAPATNSVYDRLSAEAVASYSSYNIILEIIIIIIIKNVVLLAS